MNYLGTGNIYSTKKNKAEKWTVYMWYTVSSFWLVGEVKMLWISDYTYLNPYIQQYVPMSTEMSEHEIHVKLLMKIACVPYTLLMKDNFATFLPGTISQVSC